MKYVDRELTVTEQQDLGALLFHLARWMQEAERAMEETYELGGDLAGHLVCQPEHGLFLIEGRRLREQAERWAKDKANYQFPMGVR